MTIRWRLSVVATQLVFLLVGTHLATGNFASSRAWFVAGLLAVVVNPQLLEPFYSRPVDVLANAILGVFLVVTAERSVAPGIWNAFLAGLVLLGALAALALVLGANRSDGRAVGVGRAARALSGVGTGRVIYTIIFFLSLAETYAVSSDEFRTLTIVWALLIALGTVNWQTIWSTLSSQRPPITVEGFAGPSNVLVSGVEVPPVGSAITLEPGVGPPIAGVVVTRIRRARDVWAELFLADASASERLGARSTLKLRVVAQESDVLGAVDVGSTDRKVSFTSLRALEIPQVVVVENSVTNDSIMFQISSAVIEEEKVRGGRHLITRAIADQIGVFDPVSRRLQRHRWVAPPGAAVHTVSSHPPEGLGDVPGSWFQVGRVIGTEVPVFLDLEEACTGHLMILGMTKMGKTTLALRLTKRLAEERRVVILDQTGEYVSKHGIDAYDPADDWAEPGVSVKGTTAGEVGPDIAKAFIEGVVAEAAAEYVGGTPMPRSILIEEAHQFIPEPAGLGFGTPGRESAYALGVLVMQIRKYGLSMVLVSQRTAVVGKSALSQCENLIAFRSVDQTGLDYLEQIAGSQVRRMLPALRQGEALVHGPAFSTDSTVAIMTSIGP